VFISILPASIFVWDKELTNWWYADYIYVEPKEVKLTFIRIVSNSKNEFPGKEVLWMDIENAPDKSFVFQTYKQAET
jgi:uncharacterized iron-regulated membrane protein